MFRAVYEFGGQQYSVLLPNEPDELLNLQISTTQVVEAKSPALQSSTPSAIYAYPYVVFLGVSYRPLPYIEGRF